MRPSYVVMTLVAAAVAAVAMAGPLRGRSVEFGLEDIGGAIQSAFSGFAGGAKKATAKAAAPTLTVSQPIAREVIEWDEYTGRFDAVETVEVRARVSGYLTEVQFKDGQDVKQGDLLFTIDPRPFERALEQAQGASSTQAQDQGRQRQLDVERGARCSKQRRHLREDVRRSREPDARGASRW